MNILCKFLLNAINSWVSILFVISYCVISFYFGQSKHDMNLFAASGAVMTVFGLFSMMQFTTIEKFINQEAIAAANTGVTGPPLAEGEYEKIVRENQERTRTRLRKELRSELRGIAFTILGTLIWAYGIYIPIL